VSALGCRLARACQTPKRKLIREMVLQLKTGIHTSYFRAKFDVDVWKNLNQLQEPEIAVSWKRSAHQADS
jgi:hypothetical protein